MEREKIKELYEKYELTKDDVFKHAHYLIITRTGIEKIQAKEQIFITYRTEKVEKDFACVLAIAEKDGVRMESYGSAVKGADFKSGNTTTWYVTEMAEKRAMSRVVLKLTGFYALGVYSEDESEEFKRK
jgi:hypothetical protein